MKTLDGERQEVWFLTGTQNLYGEQTLNQVAGQSSEVVTQLAKGVD